jgi:hypothetical protein
MKYHPTLNTILCLQYYIDTVLLAFYDYFKIGTFQYYYRRPPIQFITKLKPIHPRQKNRGLLLTSAKMLSPYSRFRKRRGYKYSKLY